MPLTKRVLRVIGLSAERYAAVHELEAAIARGYDGLRAASDAAWVAGAFVAWSRERRGDYVLWLRMAERRLPT